VQAAERKASRRGAKLSGSGSYDLKTAILAFRVTLTVGIYWSSANETFTVLKNTLFWMPTCQDDDIRFLPGSHDERSFDANKMKVFV